MAFLRGSGDIALRTAGRTRPGHPASDFSCRSWPQPTREFKRLAVAGVRGTRPIAMLFLAALLGEGAQAVLRRIRHGDVAEILDCVGDAAAVVEIVLPHEGGAAEPHDGGRLRGEGF